VRIFPSLLLPLLLTVFTSAHSQDTISFGGIYDLPGAEVRATYTPVSPLAQRFTVEEVYRLPGTFYDPARLVALLPGVVQTNDQANHLSVRGNTPNANLWRLNGLAIVNPNHTANAGTFYDFPTLSGGGVNAISAQMLGNSGFLAGGLPVEYGYATGGTFDLRLRPGNKTRRKYQAQAGFIGFDLMVEGPIGDSGKTSYLVNGRYSFTGLLADMGVDFGGESIRFWDFNAHLHHEWDGGELSLFSIVGASSNVFAGPDSTEQEITEQKELFDIDFDSEVQIYGLSFSHQVKTNSFRGGFSASKVKTDRSQMPVNIPPTRNAAFFTLDPGLFNANFVWEKKINEFYSFKLGVEYFDQTTTYELSFGNGGLSGGAGYTSLAPFVGLVYSINGLIAEVGIRNSNYFNTPVSHSFLEPRIDLQYEWNRQSLRLNVGAQSRGLIAEDLMAFPLPEYAVLTNHLDLTYSRRIGEHIVKAALYYQSTPNDVGFQDNSFIVSSNSILEFDPRSPDFVSAETRRYGVELEAGGGSKQSGWYYRGSIGLFNAETQQVDGSWAKDRFSNDFNGKLTIGREWPRLDKKQRETTLGLNFALITHGGERYGRSIPFTSTFDDSRRFFAPQDFSNGFINSNGTYFRPDLRLYKTKTRKKTTTTLALDVQNAANVQNLTNVYYDAFLEQPTERYQLGLIPVLSYRIVWR
jgi:hypothetical protein